MQVPPPPVRLHGPTALGQPVKSSRFTLWHRDVDTVLQLSAIAARKQGSDGLWFVSATATGLAYRPRSQLRLQVRVVGASNA
jgi:hypothetical protein